ncbi:MULTISPECIES: phasin family protein [unclassified Yoonia]|uniref:phasin family protein n=1 Tax=unclassified Yoonia TaxID=2629118 RepID=UPI002AFECF01|nr:MULTISPECIES: phasin family protein [unclassified Yoonia]
MTQDTDKDCFAPDVLDTLAAVTPAATWMNTAWIEAMTEVGSELATFVAERLRQDIELQQALLRCRSLAEVPHVQAEFFQKALDQYQAETGKLIEITGKMAAELHPAPKAD